jgi:adenylate cyclase
MNAYVTESLDKEDGLAHFEIRIGIHTGPVIAGIVGIKKWQYGIWGDTVNIASRMESAGRPGKVNCSEATMQLIQEHYACEYRGEIEVKNRGSLKMYFVTGEKKL